MFIEPSGWESLLRKERARLSPPQRSLYVVAGKRKKRQRTGLNRRGGGPLWRREGIRDKLPFFIHPSSSRCVPLYCDFYSPHGELTRTLIKVYSVRYCTYNDKLCFSSSFFISYTSGYFNSLENKNFPSHCFFNLVTLLMLQILATA